MKEISTSQYHTIAGGFADQCGRGPSSSSGNCSSGGSGSAGGNAGNRAPQITNSKGKPGSGVLAGGYFSNNPGTSSAGSRGCTGGRREVGSNR
ncbi:hypothetical protein MUA02_11805 [Enterobacteriaceae bacterium H20N1]|uniref:Uncharacterized protein n=1 Tax=Dryocola boscaweniae TaxID=2925397 RepID=A0A9X2W7G6_9ENTR|nr:hypothetical protein [Dryocola boscaweniae]MCT4702548.1 hypothetical protein [Dryocola boscaweniae]MCT4719716.1 hypothetical protein [Dryocola boscaweniae]